MVFAAHELYELFVDDLHDHLGGGQAFQHIGANGALRDLLDKVLDDFIADICLQKCQTDLPHGLLHIALPQGAFAPEPFEGGRQFFG